MSARVSMLEAARSACLAALQAVEACVEAEDEAPAMTNTEEDFSSLTFDDPPPSADPAPHIRRRSNANGKR